jgi:hypothetical protein
VKGVLFNGKNIVIPQAVSRVDSSALNSVTLGGANRLAIIGEMVGLVQPKAATKISTPALARLLIHPNSEEALLGAELAFTPSPGSGTNGASEVYLIPVNPSTQAEATIDGKLKLTSFMYGTPANQVRYKVETGTSAGKKVSIDYQGNVEVFDNLTKSSFSVQYTGAGSACALTINVTAATHKLTTVCTGADGDNLDIDLNVYTTIQQLVDAIQANGKYTCTVLTNRPKVDLSMQLDAVTAQAIKDAAYTCKSDLQACVDGVLSSYAKASRVADAGAVPANVTVWTYLAGADNGTVTNDDWNDVLNLLSTMPMDLIVPLTSDAAIHAMVDAHAIYMSGPSGKKERRVFVGGALQGWSGEAARATALGNIKAAIKAINSDRVMNACLGSYHYDQNNQLKLYPAYITACMYAGIAAGGKPTLPLTRKYLRTQGLEIELRISEIEDLLQNGGAPPMVDLDYSNGYVISQQLTTWLQDDDDYRCEFSVGRGADYIAAQVRMRHGIFVGSEGIPAMDTSVINITNAVLQAALKEEMITSYDPKATSLRVVGKYRYVDYSAAPVLPINNIFSTYHLKQNNYTITL